MIDFLIILLGITCLNTEGGRFWPFFLITVTAMIYHITPIDGYWIYLIAGLIDLGVIAMLCLLTRIDRYVLFIALVSLISVILNAGGWVMYEWNLEPDLYNQAYLILYGLVIVSSWGQVGKNDSRAAGRGNRFYLDDHQRYHNGVGFNQP